MNLKERRAAAHKERTVRKTLATILLIAGGGGLQLAGEAFRTNYKVCSSEANIFLILCFALISVSCGKGSIER